MFDDPWMDEGAVDRPCYAITEHMPDLGEILREVNAGLSDIHRASLKQHLGRTEPDTGDI